MMETKYLTKLRGYDYNYIEQDLIIKNNNAKLIRNEQQIEMLWVFYREKKKTNVDERWVIDDYWN